MLIKCNFLIPLPDLLIFTSSVYPFIAFVMLRVLIYYSLLLTYLLSYIIVVFLSMTSVSYNKLFSFFPPTLIPLLWLFLSIFCRVGALIVLLE